MARKGLIDRIFDSIFDAEWTGRRGELKKITVESGVPVINRDRLYKTIRNIWNDSADALDGEQVDKLIARLEPLTHATAAEREAHVEDIKRRFG